MIGMTQAKIAMDLTANAFIAEVEHANPRKRIGKHSRPCGQRGEQRRVEHDNGTDEKQRTGPGAKRVGVHHSKRADQLTLRRNQILAVKDGSPQQIEHHGHRCVGNHRQRGVQVHDPNPALGTPLPIGRIVLGTGVGCVSFFHQPIVVGHDLIAPDTGDSKSAHGDEQDSRSVGMEGTRPDKISSARIANSVDCNAHSDANVKIVKAPIISSEAFSMCR